MTTESTPNCAACNEARPTELNTCSVCDVTVCHDHATWTEDGETAFCLPCTEEALRLEAGRILRLVASMIRGHREHTAAHWEAEKALLALDASMVEEVASYLAPQPTEAPV
ncbi:hypothetical protein [Deinococcus multiflagellatus]|uniref:Uncharacterized protein n=1 Tax=Deinococcus multiflagellatus TaxID=1656887 RepID=A0ABW1ZQF5_9DEIO|nr:hypothetical protein [Deinococcus multiflagellatus]MBZ9715360.1 hypothetical protein [Deinococcus multiflagellatus]